MTVVSNSMPASFSSRRPSAGLDADGDVLHAGAVVLDELRDLGLGRGALEQHDGERPGLEDGRDHRRRLPSVRRRSASSKPSTLV